jgi:hypothetical protein
MLDCSVRRERKNTLYKVSLSMAFILLLLVLNISCWRIMLGWNLIDFFIATSSNEIEFVESRGIATVDYY